MPVAAQAGNVSHSAIRSESKLMPHKADRMLTAGHNTDIRKYISSMMDATRRGAQNDLQHLQPGTSLTSFKLECDKAQAGNQPMPLVWFCDPKALDWETICLACFYIRRIGNLRASQSLELRYAPKQRTPDFRFARANTDPPAMQTHLLLYTALSMAERRKLTPPPKSIHVGKRGADRP